MKDAGCRPQSVFASFLHECVGDRVFAIGCGGDDFDNFAKAIDIFLPDFVEVVVLLSCCVECALGFEVGEESHGCKGSWGLGH